MTRRDAMAEVVEEVADKARHYVTVQHPGARLFADKCVAMFGPKVVNMAAALMAAEVARRGQGRKRS